MLTEPSRRRHVAPASVAIALTLLAACGGGASPSRVPPTAPLAATNAAQATSPATAAAGGPVVVQAAGEITATVEQYRSLLGANNGGDPGPKPAGRREINWDGVPDNLAAPNNLPADFFNAAAAPRARGAFLSTPGTALQVSANSKNPTGTLPRFGNINPTYVDLFKAFSPERLFSPIGSNIVDLTFFVPGTQIPALVRGYGAVYTNVNAQHTAFEYFDKDGKSLGTYTVPPAPRGLSFLGVIFASPVVAHVRIQYGTVALGPNDDATNNVAVMDDFIYGEPQATPGATAATASPGSTATVAATGGGFKLFDGSVNRDAGQAAREPALAVGATTVGGPVDLWVAWAETIAGGKRQVFVSERVGDAFQARGASLNVHQDSDGIGPTIGFAGDNRAVPWTTWSEASPKFAGATQVFASRFDASKGVWQPAGQDRGSGEPSLNFNTSRNAADPFVFPGSGDPTKPPVPWIVWLEDSAGSNFAQLFVARAVKDTAAIGGFHWTFVGAIGADKEPTINVDAKRDAVRPSGVFAETDNAVPWVVWHEIGAGRPGRIFTARGVADANTPGGFKWINVPPCTPNEAACALNVNPAKDAADATMAAGSLKAGEASVPWIVWAEVGPTGKDQILVSRLDTTTRNSFLNVGGSLNVDQNHNARLPSIRFVGNVPYVAWLEDDGSGHFTTQLRHLASDPQTGTWVLDSPPGGFRRAAGVNQTGLFAASVPDSLFVAWTEGDPDKVAAQVLAGLFKP